MTKKELGEKISEQLNLVHSSIDPETLLTRLDAMKQALLLAKEYLEKYKAPYTHRFMNTPLQLREPFIEALKEQLVDAYNEYHKDNYGAKTN